MIFQIRFLTPLRFGQSAIRRASFLAALARVVCSSVIPASGQAPLTAAIPFSMGAVTRNSDRSAGRSGIQRAA